MMNLGTSMFRKIKLNFRRQFFTNSLKIDFFDLFKKSLVLAYLELSYSFSLQNASNQLCFHISHSRTHAKVTFVRYASSNNPTKRRATQTHIVALHDHHQIMISVFSVNNNH